MGKHNNITELLDAGMTEEGRSYFVMEYVDGQWIDKYCDIYQTRHSLAVQAISTSV